MQKLAFALALSALSGVASSAPPSDFLGVTIGDPFALPECAWQGDDYLAKYVFIFDQPVRPCWQHSILKSRPGEPLDTNASFKIDFLPSKERSPRGVDTRSTSMIVVNGKIEGVQAGTTGYKDQEHLLGLLIEKYGKPSDSQAEAVQNRAGATFTSLSASWQLSDAEVQFTGLGSSIDFGFIQVLSPSASSYLAAEAERKRSSAPKL